MTESKVYWVSTFQIAKPHIVKKNIISYNKLPERKIEGFIMDMTFNELHAEACRECGQSNRMFGQVLLNEQLEREGLEEFKQDKSTSCLDRAIKIYMPYFDPNRVEHVKYANLYALAIANHRLESHNEEMKDDIEVYKVMVKTSFEDGEERVERAVRGWWDT